MDYKFKDIVTGAELTADNFIRYLNGYLDTVNIVDKDVTENLLLYIERALELGGVDLANAAIGVITADLYYQDY